MWSSEGVKNDYNYVSNIIYLKLKIMKKKKIFSILQIAAIVASVVAGLMLILRTQDGYWLEIDGVSSGFMMGFKDHMANMDVFAVILWVFVALGILSAHTLCYKSRILKPIEVAGIAFLMLIASFAITMSAEDAFYLDDAPRHYWVCIIMVCISLAVLLPNFLIFMIKQEKENK